jgi:hypothetical protein
MLMIDTKDLPTEHGSLIYKDSKPGVDAAVVGMLRAAGATIVGKTVSIDFVSISVRVHSLTDRRPANSLRGPKGRSRAIRSTLGIHPEGPVPALLRLYRTISAI